MQAKKRILFHGEAKPQKKTDKNGEKRILRMIICLQVNKRVVAIWNLVIAQKTRKFLW